MKRVEELQDNERRMSEFLAMLGHELRNPLSPLQSALDILELKPNDPRAIEWTRKVFGRQVRQLAHLVDDLLDIGRITSGKVQLRLAPVNLGQLVQETLEGMRPQLDARSQTLVISLPDDPVTVRGDATHLAQIVTNLVGNACKYTQDGGRIEVSLEVEGGFVTLRVADNGTGLAPDLVPRMFELFVQGSRALDRKEGGLGIGLTLVKRLAEMHGGTVAGASAGLNQGSEFTVRLPVIAAEQQRQTDDRIASGAAGPYRVMVVDDNPDGAQSLAMLVSTMGHVVEIAGDGVEALARAPLFAPDLVLLDIGLPRMSGYDVARVMRSLPTLEKTRIVACTGYGQEEDRRRVQEAGFDDHLVKPVRIEDLRTIFARMTPPAPSLATGTG
jgi:CheY-like chemotaxis protein